MRLERISDDQIRCDLTREDLGQRGIRLEDLTYGSSAAEDLFRELVEEAGERFHMDFSDVPCVIEAVPMGDVLTLFLTRVEDPEELNLRYARFTEREGEESTAPAPVQRVDDVISLVKQMAEHASHASAEKTEAGPAAKAPAKEASVPLTLVFRFADTDRAGEAAAAVQPFFAGESFLYRADDGLYLTIEKGETSTEDFNRACNILMEYGQLVSGTQVRAAWLSEHARCLIAGKAIRVLAQL